MFKVFIDGSAGTTGLRINERLAGRRDPELIRLPEEHRKDAQFRQDALNKADIAFLRLPDSAADESVLLVQNPNTAIIDTSTAHRVAQGWVYGFPEIGNRKASLSPARVKHSHGSAQGSCCGYQIAAAE